MLLQCLWLLSLDIGWLCILWTGATIIELMCDHWTTFFFYSFPILTERLLHALFTYLKKQSIYFFVCFPGWWGNKLIKVVQPEKKLSLIEWKKIRYAFLFSKLCWALYTVIMPHYVLKRLWIGFISPFIRKKPSVVAMKKPSVVAVVNDLYTVNCNFLQLLIKWLRLLCQISTVLTLIYLSRRDLLNTRYFFPSSTCKVIIQYLQGVWEVGDERGMKQALFSYCCILPQAELQIIVGHWTKKDSLVVHESCMWHKSSSLLYKLPNCPDKIGFWAFLCFKLYFSPFSSKKNIIHKFFRSLYDFCGS